MAPGLGRSGAQSKAVPDAGERVASDWSPGSSAYFVAVQKRSKTLPAELEDDLESQKEPLLFGEGW